MVSVGFSSPVINAMVAIRLASLRDGGALTMHLHVLVEVLLAFVPPLEGKQLRL